MADQPKLDERLLGFHQVNVLQKWTTQQFIDGMQRHGIGGVALWREKLSEHGAPEVARMLRGTGLKVLSLCAAGLITTPDPKEAASSIDELKRAIDDAATIGAGSLMFISGGVDPRDKSLESTRRRALERLADLTSYVRAAGIKIALEPLHPMACARSVISSVRIANDWCDALQAEDVFGIAIDTYAVWWDPDLPFEIARAGKRICSFHIADWLADTQDLRLDRGMPGDGLIDLPGIRRMVEAAGYTGHREIEIFSARNWWQRDPEEVIGVVKDRYQTAV
ncbi:MAG TPA: sugar phosphate isomerase/epimerase family protein [Hyphomicrobiaceae bacterium]|jgi:sugar phosphate isomerase/epimerase|nr:sugar phosphate isomerase/epimerase family protein [Hyphomicrobiaceae bacterium]